MKISELEFLLNCYSVEDLLFTIFESRLNMSRLNESTLKHIKKCINIELSRKKYCKKHRRGI